VKYHTHVRNYLNSLRYFPQILRHFIVLSSLFIGPGNEANYIHLGSETHNVKVHEIMPGTLTK